MSQFHRDLRNLESCVAKKSTANPNGLNRDEMIALCKSLGLKCNTKTTKAEMCQMLIDYYDTGSVSSVESLESPESPESPSSLSRAGTFASGKSSKTTASAYVFTPPPVEDWKMTTSFSAPAPGVDAAFKKTKLKIKKMVTDAPAAQAEPDKKVIVLDECASKKTIANPNGNSREELVEMCKSLNIKHTTKTTKIEMCRMIKAYYDKEHGRSPSLNLSPSPLAVAAATATAPVKKARIVSKKTKTPEMTQVSSSGSGNQDQDVATRTYNETYTLTFGDQAENHKGMEIIGQMVKEGFTIEDLNIAEKWFKSKGLKTEMIDLLEYLPREDRPKADPAWVLVIRKAVKVLTGATADDFYDEQERLPKDTKAFMYGKVLNKKARHNLCFSEQCQEPNYEQKMGRIVAFKDLPLLNNLRNRLPDTIGPKARSLVAEGNYYHKPSECGIGWHGDSERKIVIALRLGLAMSMQYQWYKNSLPVGERCKLVLEHGDIYYMSEKAVGTDWKSRSKYTLRHAAGSKKFTDPPPKKKATEVKKRSKTAAAAHLVSDDEGQQREEAVMPSSLGTTDIKAKPLSFNLKPKVKKQIKGQAADPTETIKQFAKKSLQLKVPEVIRGIMELYNRPESDIRRAISSEQVKEVIDTMIEDYELDGEVDTFVDPPSGWIREYLYDIMPDVFYNSEEDES